MATIFQPQITGGAVITVASSEQSDAIKAKADYVCTGTNDEQVIAAAITDATKSTATVYETIQSVIRSAQLGGVTIQLTSGGFYFGSALSNTTVHNLTIRGEGPGTTIFNQATDGSHAISMIGSGLSYGLWHPVVCNLRIQGNENSGFGVYFLDTPHATIRDVVTTRNGAGGIYLGCPETSPKGQDNHLISGCRSQINYGYGMHIDRVHETQITGCHVEENLNHGVYCTTVTDIAISNCSFEDHGDVGSGKELYITAQVATQISNTVCEGDAYIGSGSCILTGCVIAGTTTLAATDLVATGCRLRAVVGTCIECTIDGGDFDSSGTLQCSGDLTLNCNITPTGATIFQATAASCKFVVSGHTLYTTSGSITLDGNGQSIFRALVTGVNARNTNIVIEDAFFASVVSSALAGGGLVTFRNCDGVITFVGNTVAYGCDVTIEDTCAALANVQCNTVEVVGNGDSTLTNSGTSLDSVVANNVVTAGGYGW